MPATVPFPYGTDKAADPRLPRAEFTPGQVPESYDPEYQRRLVAEMARCFNALDMAVAQIERRLRIIEETLP